VWLVYHAAVPSPAYRNVSLPDFSDSITSAGRMVKRSFQNRRRARENCV
jgi:hypothetical protein